MALTAQTDIQTILFAVKGRFFIVITLVCILTEIKSWPRAVLGKPEHTMNGFVTTSEKGGRYLLHGMKKHLSDIVKEFESYVLGDLEGAHLNESLASLYSPDARSCIESQQLAG